MSSLKRFTVGAAAAALATGMTLGGTAIASAAPGGSLDLGDDVVDQLTMAVDALSGPVTVTGNSEGGPTVTYANTTGADQNCIGMTIPYTTIDELGITSDSFDADDMIGSLQLINAIEAEGGVSVLNVKDGEPDAYDSDVPNNKGFSNAVTSFNLGLADGAPVAAGDTLTWNATAPTAPAAAVVLCKPGTDGADMDTAFGIDKQVVADQLNAKLGPLGSVAPSMISAGSLETGVSILDLISGSAGGDGDVDEE